MLIILIHCIFVQMPELFCCITVCLFCPAYALVLPKKSSDILVNHSIKNDIKDKVTERKLLGK